MRFIHFPEKFTVHVYGHVVHYVSSITPLSTTAVPACLGFLCDKTALNTSPIKETRSTCLEIECAL
jgi:hypothetical protein